MLFNWFFGTKSKRGRENDDEETPKVNHAGDSLSTRVIPSQHRVILQIGGRQDNSMPRENQRQYQQKQNLENSFPQRNSAFTPRPSTMTPTALLNSHREHSSDYTRLRDLQQHPFHHRRDAPYRSRSFPRSSCPQNQPEAEIEQLRVQQQLDMAMPPPPLRMLSSAESRTTDFWNSDGRIVAKRRRIVPPSRGQYLSQEKGRDSESSSQSSISTRMVSIPLRRNSQFASHSPLDMERLRIDDYSFESHEQLPPVLIGPVIPMRAVPKENFWVPTVDHPVMNNSTTRTAMKGPQDNSSDLEISKNVRIIHTKGFKEMSYLKKSKSITSQNDAALDNDSSPDKEERSAVRRSQKQQKIDVKDPEYMKGNWGGIFEEQKNVAWKCDVCLIANYDDIGTKCLSCGNPRYEANGNNNIALASSSLKRRQKKTETTSQDVTPDFSFGISHTQCLPNAVGTASQNPSSRSDSATGKTNSTLTSTGFRFGVLNSSTAEAAKTSIFSAITPRSTTMPESLKSNVAFSFDEVSITAPAPASAEHAPASSGGPSTEFTFGSFSNEFTSKRTISSSNDSLSSCSEPSSNTTVAAAAALVPFSFGSTGGRKDSDPTATAVIGSAPSLTSSLPTESSSRRVFPVASDVITQNTSKRRAYDTVHKVKKQESVKTPFYFGNRLMREHSTLSSSAPKATLEVKNERIPPVPDVPTFASSPIDDPSMNAVNSVQSAPVTQTTEFGFFSAAPTNSVTLDSNSAKSSTYSSTTTAAAVPFTFKSAVPALSPVITSECISSGGSQILTGSTLTVSKCMPTGSTSQPTESSTEESRPIFSFGSSIEASSNSLQSTSGTIGSSARLESSRVTSNFNQGSSSLDNTVSVALKSPSPTGFTFGSSSLSSATITSNANQPFRFSSSSMSGPVSSLVSRPLPAFPMAMSSSPQLPSTTPQLNVDQTSSATATGSLQFGLSTSNAVPSKPFTGSSFGSTTAPPFGNTQAPSFGDESAPAASFGIAPIIPSFGGAPAQSFGNVPVPSFGVASVPFTENSRAFGSGSESAPHTSAFGNGFRNSTTPTIPVPSFGLESGAQPTAPVLGGFGQPPVPAFSTTSTMQSPSVTTGFGGIATTGTHGTAASNGGGNGFSIGQATASRRTVKARRPGGNFIIRR